MAEASHSNNDGRKPEVRPFRFKHGSSSKEGKKHRKHREREDSRVNQTTDGIHKRPRDRMRHDGPHKPAFRHPDIAFQESLFDAMADDEGAAFWESVYGQPIHIYSNQRLGPNGESERMTDEEYAKYVRAKMFEKTHEHLLEEKRKHEKASSRRNNDSKTQEDDQSQNAEIERNIEESLQRSRERRRKRHAEQAWNKYLKDWEGLLSAKEESKAIPWPTHERQRDDVNEEELSRFFRTAALLDTSPDSEDALYQILKIERVRWHPDKMQQRLGHMEDTDMAAVTAVFQIIDKLWGELRAQGVSK